MINAEYQKYDNAEIVWAQEEPMNMGYWTYVSSRLVTAVGNKPKIRFLVSETIAAEWTWYFVSEMKIRFPVFGSYTTAR